MTTPIRHAQAPVLPLRSAHRVDLPAIERMLAIAGLESTGIAELLDRAGDVVVAGDTRRPGELAAVAAIEVCGKYALLRSVAVHPDWRQHRLGAAVVGRMVDIARQRGVRALYLLTTTAEGYFPKVGFEAVDRGAVPEEIAETEEFRSMCPASAVVMTRALEV